MAKNRRQRRCFPSMMGSRPCRIIHRPRVEIDRSLAWYCVWTQARVERQAQEDLGRAGFATYLPTQRIEIVRRGRLVETERVPVGRYLFVGLQMPSPDFGGVEDALGWRPADWYRPAVGSLLRIDREPIRIGAGALQAFADECAGNGLLGAASGRLPLARYQRARIISGALSGLVIQISDVLCDERVRGLVNLFGGRVSVEATVDQLEAA
jgi:hypothetical protein